LQSASRHNANFVYEDNTLRCILTPEGRALPDGSGGFEYQYFLKDHLGNTRVTFAQTGTVLQEDSYYPFGMAQYGFAYQSGTSYKNKYLYNGTELQDDFGLNWYVPENLGFFESIDFRGCSKNNANHRFAIFRHYGARFYDAVLGRWHSVDPLAEDYYKRTPFNYTLNNPIKLIDPNGSFVDGYQDLNGNYKWYDDQTEDIIYDDNDGFMLKVTDDKKTFDMLEAGVLDNLPESSEQEVINEVDNLTSFEMWLNSPSESFGEGIVKAGMNIGYSMVNSPTVLFTGYSLGGTEAIPQEKMDAFIDVVPAVISLGMTKTKEVVKVTENGLQGFNRFVKKSGISFSGKAGNKEQVNCLNQIKLINKG